MHYPTAYMITSIQHTCTNVILPMQCLCDFYKPHPQLIILFTSHTHLSPLHFVGHSDGVVKIRQLHCH